MLKSVVFLWRLLAPASLASHDHAWHHPPFSLSLKINNSRVMAVNTATKDLIEKQCSKKTKETDVEKISKNREVLSKAYL